MSGGYGFPENQKCDGSGKWTNTTPYPVVEKYPQASSLPQQVNPTSNINLNNTSLAQNTPQVNQLNSLSVSQTVQSGEFHHSGGGQVYGYHNNILFKDSQRNSQISKHSNPEMHSLNRGDNIGGNYQFHENPYALPMNSSNKQIQQNLFLNSNTSSHSGHHQWSVASFPSVKTVPVIPQSLEIDILEDRMREENERSDREHEERMKKKREERARRKELLEKEISSEMKKNELDGKQKLREERIKMENERREMERELQKDTIQKEKKYQTELEDLKQHGVMELEEMKSQRQREKLIHEKVVNERDDEFLMTLIRHQEETEAMNEELTRKQAENDERIGQIYIQLELEKEEMQRKNEIRMSQMKQQWEQIKLMLQYKIWNEIIEKNWTNRLNVLRSSTRKIMELFHRFFNNALKMQSHIGNSELFLKEKQKSIPMLNVLIAAINPEKIMLSEESENLEIQWQNTGKTFVFYVKESVEKVKYACEEFENALKNYLEFLEKNDQVSQDEHSYHLKLVKKRFESLFKHSNDIPTLAELKRNNGDEMRQEHTSDTHHQYIIPTQSVIIEDIE